MQRAQQLPTWLGVVASVLAVVCEQMQQLLTTRKGACKRRTQQLPTLLRQQWWELLHPCWQWCANGCNNSQQCWDLQCIVGTTQPISLCKPCVMSVRGPNNVGRAVQTDPTLLRYAWRSRNKRNVASCWLKSLTGFKLCTTTRNNIQQHATGCANERNM